MSKRKNDESERRLRERERKKIRRATESIEERKLSRVAFIGHSYCRDLSRLNPFSNALGSGQFFDHEFFYVPGSNVKDWSSHPKQLENVIRYEPNIIVLILGGNYLLNHVSNAEWKDKYQKLIDIIKIRIESCRIIAVEIESRFVKNHNAFNAPTEEGFNARKKTLNNWLNKNPSIHHVCMISHTINNKSYYHKDGVHLTKTGLSMYYGMIHRTLKYVFNKI